MEELGGGGLKRRVCQFVDCKFYTSALVSGDYGFKLPDWINLKMVGADCVVLINEF